MYIFYLVRLSNYLLCICFFFSDRVPGLDWVGSVWFRLSGDHGFEADQFLNKFSSSWSSAVRVSIIVLYLSLLFDDVSFCLPFCWCPCMAINVSVQYDGGFLPDIILLTQCYYHRGTRLNAMKRFCIFSY